MKINLQLTQLLNILKKVMVGETGVEPATSWSRTKRATRLRYSPTRRKLVYEKDPSKRFRDNQKKVI